MSYCRLGEARHDAAHIYREDRNTLLAVAEGNGRRIGENHHELFSSEEALTMATVPELGSISR